MDALSMHNREMLDYTVKEIRKMKVTPFHMSNKQLADELFPYIKDVFPDAMIVKCGISQWITISKKAQNTLIKQLNSIKKDHEKAILEIENAISELTDKDYQFSTMR